MANEETPKPKWDGPFTARGADPVTESVPGLMGRGPSARDRLLVALRDQGMSYREMAQSLGLTSPSGLRVAVSNARKKLRAVKAQFELACERMDQEVVPLAVERMAGMVEAGVPEAVFRTLEGRGVLKQHRNVDGNAAPGASPTLSITFQQVALSPTVAAGSIVGTPRGQTALPAPPSILVSPEPVSR